MESLFDIGLEGRSFGEIFKLSLMVARRPVMERSWIRPSAIAIRMALAEKEFFYRFPPDRSIASRSWGIYDTFADAKRPIMVDVPFGTTDGPECWPRSLFDRNRVSGSLD